MYFAAQPAFLRSTFAGSAIAAGAEGGIQAAGFDLLDVGDIVDEPTSRSL
jgi:hypothetical protein